MEKGTERSERLLPERMMGQSWPEPIQDGCRLRNCATMLSIMIRDATHHDIFPGRYIKALQNCVERFIMYRFRSDNSLDSPVTPT